MALSCDENRRALGPTFVGRRAMEFHFHRPSSCERSAPHLKVGLRGRRKRGRPKRRWVDKVKDDIKEK